MWSNICTQASKKFTCMHMQTHTYRHVWTKRATTTTKPLLCMMHSDIFFCVLFYSILSIYLILIYFNSILSYSYKPHSWETGHGTFHLLAVTSFHMEPGNATRISEFLLGISKEPEWQYFGHFLSMYLITVFGNLLIILCQLRLPPPHAHLFPPLKPVLCRHLFYLHHHLKDAVEHPEPEQSYGLWRLYHPDVFFHALCRVGHLSPDSDGLWLLYGHLSPPELHNHHEPSALWIAGPGVLDDECPKFLATDLTDVVAVLL